MAALVIEEDVRTKRLQYLALCNATQKKGLINTDIPCTQSSDHPFMRRCIACSHKGGAYRCMPFKFLLQGRNRLEKLRKGSLRQYLSGTCLFMLCECLQTVLLKYLFARI